MVQGSTSLHRCKGTWKTGWLATSRGANRRWIMPLYVAFIWHMHQPYYKGPLTGRYLLPWVRLHAVKDYLHMAEVLARYPRIHVTINVVPSLIIQLIEYVSGEAVDAAMDLGLKSRWDEEEKRYMLQNFFSINHERILNRYPPYRKLLDLRPYALADPDLFSASYYRDLVTWFNLAWIDPNKLESDPFLRELVERGQNFTRKDFEKLMDKHREIMAQIIPLYRELESKGQIELSTSPYYHPILPLLIDVRVARRPSPQLPLPSMPFAHPEDAEEQLRRAVGFHRSLFGHPPKGLWPPEGAVCQELIPLLVRQDFLWFASDEAILARSLGVNLERDEFGNLIDPHPLYQPYRVNVNGKTVFALFRDRVLSDRISFVYQHMDGEEAARDLVSRLHLAKDRLNDEENPYLVTIILDGENCWEYYEHNGDVFLNHLYAMLSEDSELECVTIREYLEKHGARREISELATGSWIGGNLETWIGEEDQNRAWEALAKVRQDLVNWQKNYPLADVEVLEKAWEAIYIAEGSDWFWWYYSRNISNQKHLFDQAFRSHLTGVYVALGLPIPEWLAQPILSVEARLEERKPSGYISPRLEASSQATSDWARAGYIQGGVSRGAMRKGRQVFKGLFYGYDPGCLYFRLEGEEPLDAYAITFYLATSGSDKVNWQFRHLDEKVEALNGTGLSWAVEIPPRGEEALLFKAEGQEVWRKVGEGLRVVRSPYVVEVALPFNSIGIGPGDNVSLVVAIIRGGEVVERLPDGGSLTFAIEENPLA
ncbi:MAG TPA: glycoside hydrolase [Chloroflexi bacterium]|nr:glycoside hydrolase [Chloroflexota bacterium]